MKIDDIYKGLSKIQELIDTTTSEPELIDFLDYIKDLSQEERQQIPHGDYARHLERIKNVQTSVYSAEQYIDEIKDTVGPNELSKIQENLGQLQNKLDIIYDNMGVEVLNPAEGEKFDPFIMASCLAEDIESYVPGEDTWVVGQTISVGYKDTNTDNVLIYPNVTTKHIPDAERQEDLIYHTLENIEDAKNSIEDLVDNFDPQADVEIQNEEITKVLHEAQLSLNRERDQLEHMRKRIPHDDADDLGEILQEVQDDLNTAYDIFDIDISDDELPFDEPHESIKDAAIDVQAQFIEQGEAEGELINAAKKTAGVGEAVEEEVKESVSSKSLVDAKTMRKAKDKAQDTASKAGKILGEFAPKALTAGALVVAAASIVDLASTVRQEEKIKRADKKTEKRLKKQRKRDERRYKYTGYGYETYQETVKRGGYKGQSILAMMKHDHLVQDMYAERSGHHRMGNAKFR